MGGFFNKLDDISNLLDGVSDKLEDVNSAVNTTNHGIKQVQKSGQNISRTIQMAVSGENEIDWKKIEEYDRRQSKSIRRTVFFCIFVILATILICVNF